MESVSCNEKDGDRSEQGIFKTDDLPKREDDMVAGSSSTVLGSCNSVHVNDYDHDGAVISDSLSDVVPSSLFSSPDIIASSLDEKAWSVKERTCIRDGVHLSSPGQVSLRRESHNPTESCVQERGESSSSSGAKDIVKHCGKENSAGLTKTFKYAAKYNLQEMFTYSFPQGKKPLRQRLL